MITRMHVALSVLVAVALMSTSMAFALPACPFDPLNRCKFPIEKKEMVGNLHEASPWQY